MSFKTKVKNHVKPGIQIVIEHMNGYEYTGEVITVDTQNAADVSLVMKDFEGDLFIMAVTGEMGVIRIPKESQKETEEIIPEIEPERLTHEPKERVKKVDEIVKVPKKKKSTNSNFVDVHAPKNRTLKRR